MKLLQTGIFLAIISLLFSCAQMSTPTGGEKDVQPPKDSLYFPNNYSVNFSSKTIEVRFDEYIKLNSASTNAIISPVMPSMPKFKVKGKKLIIELPDSLQQNTTYSIQLPDVIQDITEGNKISNFKYVFSTGNELDSLSISGKAIDAFTLKPMEKILVMLYKEMSDSIIFKEKPFYLSKSNSSGVFSLTNLKEGNYKLVAVKDENSNYLFDVNEEIAFVDSIIVLNKNKSNVNLYSFKEDHRKQQVKEAKYTSPAEISIIFNKPFEKMDVSMSGKTLIYKQAESRLKDSLKIVLKAIPPQDSIFLYLSDADFSDTIAVVKPTPIDTNLMASKTSLIGNKQPIFKPFELLLSSPLKSIDEQKVLLTEDSVEVKINALIKGGFDNQLVINYAWKEDASYQLYVLPEAVRSIYEITNDTLQYSFRIMPEEDFGKVKITLFERKETTIIELIQQEKVVKRVFISPNQKEVEFTGLVPGKYDLKMIVDENNNGYWDTGNYLSKKQAEKTYFFKGGFSIKANWEQEVKWVVE
jgi:uncharacterized protein (DUF2141 family)